MASSQENLDKLPLSEERPKSDETVRIKEERQTTPGSPRRNGIPPKRPLVTARRTAGTTQNPATMSTASSASRGTTGSGLSKPPTHLATSSTARRPPTNVTAATATSSRHRVKASMSSFDDDNKAGTSSADENKKQAVGRVANPISIADPTSQRSPAAKSLQSTNDRRSTLRTAASIERQIGARINTVSPPKSALKPTTNNARPSTVSIAARSARPTISSSRGTPSKATSGLAKKRLSITPASPAPARSNVGTSDSETAASATSRKPTRPALATRKSTMSVTIEQRLLELEAVNQMLRAAMAEDGDESDEVKEEYGKKVDEGLASLRSKLEEARQREAKEGTSPIPTNDIHSKVGQARTDESAIEKTPSHTRATEPSEIDARQLQMALEASQEKVQVLEAEVKVLQAKNLNYSMTAIKVSKDFQEATENIRKEHALEIDEIVIGHTSELNSLRARFDKEKTSTISALKADLATERANGTETTRRLQRALSNVSTLEGRLEEQRRTSEQTIEEKDRALEVKDQDILTLHDELQELQDKQSRELDELQSASLRNSSALESEIIALRAGLVMAEDYSLSASARNDEFAQGKDREIKRMHEIIENLQDGLQQLRESKERELDSEKMRLVQEHENVLESLRARHQTALHAAQQQSVEAAQSTRLAHEQEIQVMLREHEIARGDLQNSLAEIIASKSGLQAHLDSLKAGHAIELSGYQANLEKSEQLLKEAKAAAREGAPEVIDKLKEEISALKLESGADKTRQINMQRDLEKASGEVTSLRKVLETFDHESRNKDDQHASVIKKLKDEAAVLAKTLDQTNAEGNSAEEMHVSALQALIDSHSKEIEELKKASDQKHDDSIRALQSQHDKLRSTFQKTEEQYNAELKKLKAQHSEALGKLKTDHSKALEKHTQILDGVKVTHIKELEELKVALDREHKSTIQQLQIQQTKLEQALSEAKEQHPAALEKLKAEHSKALEKHSATLDEVNNAHSKEVEELRLRLEREYTQFKREVEASCADKASEAERKHLRDLEALREGHEQKYTELQQELEDGRIRSTSEMHTAHEAALSDLRLKIKQQKEALAQAKGELQVAQDRTKDSQGHEALLTELKIELEQAASVKKELESALQHVTQERDELIPVVEELENLKRDLPNAKAEAEQHREAVEAAKLEIKELHEKLAAANSEAEEHKANHQKTSVELSVLQTEIANTNVAASEATEAEAYKIKQDLETLQGAADAERVQNTKLKTLLRKAEEAAEQHTTRIREVEAALKVTTAELTEMQTKRAEGCEFVSSPSSKGGLRLSRWPAGSPTENGEKKEGAEGEELGPHIEGTMAGLQEQVRQLEDVNEDMLEETARIVSMLSKITESNALEEVSSRGTSPPPPLHVGEVVEG
ncbi:MAG: hypothetical protein FRX48_03109 [Lasallia pustulata]|uniref:Uncharacterized protein n=1 Tax=Lasallia pustulata TaxID=136370 RepID=A0A5M8PXF6_9LECA|nr:MAG: hypothetical protein FRX48_03109 [Lasallia pustulata]